MPLVIDRTRVIGVKVIAGCCFCGTSNPSKAYLLKPPDYAVEQFDFICDECFNDDECLGLVNDLLARTKSKGGNVA